MHLSNSLLKYYFKNVFVRSEIWTHARIRGLEHSQLAAMQAMYYPWVWRLRPLGHPDSCNNDALWQTFDWTTLRSLRYHSFYALPTQSLTYSFANPYNHPYKYVQVQSYAWRIAYFLLSCCCMQPLVFIALLYVVIRFLPINTCRWPIEDKQEVWRPTNYLA